MPQAVRILHASSEPVNFLEGYRRPVSQLIDSVAGNGRKFILPYKRIFESCRLLYMTDLNFASLYLMPFQPFTNDQKSRQFRQLRQDLDRAGYDGKSCVYAY